ncbi:MAG: hypothetical protein ACYC55_05335 [Candidatus Geothermincolia bacterium]
MRGGRRNMYLATGQPGWMRLGYSPGWVGRSASGLGPCAEFLTTGNVAPAMRRPAPGDPGAELESPRAWERNLESLLQQARDRIAQLGEE